jgi:hypothetical protein
MAMVNLMKKQVSYEKDGEQKTATNFFAKCGDILVPIEVKYFENKDTGRDDRYRERRVLLSAFAEELPDLPDKKSGKKPVLQPCEADGQGIPF